MITPKQIGLPDKFASWRPGQETIVTNMLHPSKRYHIPVVPTGGGKSPSYMAAAMLNRGRTLILTSTKGLQDQLAKDFGKLVAIQKGKAAYKCRMSGEKYWCNTGTCRWGFDCPYRNDGCYYHDSIRAARTKKIVVTNYAFWMANQPDVLGQFSLLVMDEAHDAAEHLLDALSMEIRKEEVVGLVKWIQPSNQGDYYQWAKILKGVVADKVKKGKTADRGKMRYLALETKLDILGKIWPSNWVVEHRGNSISFDAIWPATLAPGYLFRNIPQVILTSAFVTRMDLAMLGVKDEEMEYIEYPSTFPADHRPVYHIPTVRLDRFITEAGMNMLATRIDNIVESRFAEKGIIHTVSYERATRIANFSRYRDFVMTHGSGEGGTSDAVAEFKKSDPPGILVSPSIVTGYDFPGDEARWQVICKVPFPDSRPLVMKARQKVNPDYGCYIALKQMVQACGRIVRSPDDWGETFVLDNHFQWVVGKYRHLLPKWWLQSVSTKQTIPECRW